MNKSTRQQRIIKRNKRIVDDYIRMREKKKNGVRIYTSEYIFLKLSEKYALSPATIEAIVFDRIPYSWKKKKD